MKIIKTISILFIACASLFPGTALSDTTSKPNIVFFLVDDLGWADVGYNGATYHLTPNIDAFSKRAMVFDNAYTMPTCSASRASLFTGMTSPRTGIYHVANFSKTPSKFFKVHPVESGHFYEKPITMLGDSIKAAGYKTGYVGKWHVTNDPTKHGFDFNAGGFGRGDPGRYFAPYKVPNVKKAPKGEYLPQRLLQEAQGFIKSKKDEPFFLCYAPYLVHRPLQAPKADIAKFRERPKEDARFDPTYGAMIEWADRVFQGVLDTLEEEGLMNNTIIVFTSDNGMNGLCGNSDPLRGEKGSCYEGGVRVPTMVYWKGKTKPIHTSALIDVVDWYPTLLKMAGAAEPEHKLDGTSLIPLLDGTATTVRDAVFCHVPCYNGQPGNDQIWQTPFSSICSGKYKLIKFYEDNHLELYDLEQDLGESENLAKSHPEIADGLHKQLLAWLEKMEAPLPTEVDSEQ